MFLLAFVVGAIGNMLWIRQIKNVVALIGRVAVTPFPIV